jgi:hypothetical protein
MIAMPLDSAVRLKLTQKKWLRDGHGFVSLLRALRLRADRLPGLNVAESCGPLSSSCSILFGAAIVRMLQITEALALRFGVGFCG